MIPEKQESTTYNIQMPLDKRFINRIGEKYGFLEVIAYAGPVGGGHKWLCRCYADDCGKEKEIRYCNLGKSTTSCGCINNKKRLERTTKHNMSHTKIYDIWKSMRQRCNNSKNKIYKNYGGRGIKVCKRWNESFDSFYCDMGDRPENKSLERRDNNGDYCPENCYWATRKEQSNNTRSNQIFYYNEQTFTVTELASVFNVTPHNIYYYIHCGYDKLTIIQKLEKKQNDSKSI